MKSLYFTGNRGSSRVIVDTAFSRLDELCEKKKVAVVVDRKVFELYRDKLSTYRFVEIDSGERNKTLKTVEKLYRRFLDWDLDRSSTVIGIGGGIICDITGFAASTYLRGLPFGFVPTTLLAMVDAGVGGKNGVNYHGYKNLVGTFSQPQFVLCDFSFLKTLPYNELKNGIAEAIKSALVSDGGLFDYIEGNSKKVIALDAKVIRKIVYGSLNVKMGIVSHDETETGERRKLNLGHTVGHAIEKTQKCAHGEAVSMGMVVSAKLSERKGILTSGETKRIEALLDSFKLPAKLKGDKRAIVEAISKDKKREGEHIHFVLLNSIGKARIEKMEMKELREALLDLC